MITGTTPQQHAPEVAALVAAVVAPPRPRRAPETAEQRQARAERDRKRKDDKRAEGKTPEQLSALQLAGELTSLCKLFPTFAPEINELVYALHQRGHETPDRARDSILQMLKQGPASVEDMIDELRFSEKTIRDVLSGLLTIGVAVEDKARTGGPENRFADVWRLTGKAARSAMVLP